MEEESNTSPCGISSVTYCWCHTVPFTGMDAELNAERIPSQTRAKAKMLELAMHPPPTQPPPSPPYSQSASGQTTGVIMLLLDNHSERWYEWPQMCWSPLVLTVQQLHIKLFNLGTIRALFLAHRGDECVHVHCWLCRGRISLLENCNAKEKYTV